jgi:hypothetical protein
MRTATTNRRQHPDSIHSSRELSKVQSGDGEFGKRLAHLRSLRQSASDDVVIGSPHGRPAGLSELTAAPIVTTGCLLSRRPFHRARGPGPALASRGGAARAKMTATGFGESARGPDGGRRAR